LIKQTKKSNVCYISNPSMVTGDDHYDVVCIIT